MEAKKSIFVETFGESPFIKVLDFFLTFDAFDYSKSQVAEETGVSRVTLDNIWDKLIKNNIIIKTRDIGRAEMFKLNKHNPQVKILLNLVIKLSEAYAENEKNKVLRKAEL